MSNVGVESDVLQIALGAVCNNIGSTNTVCTSASSSWTWSLHWRGVSYGLRDLRTLSLQDLRNMRRDVETTCCQSFVVLSTLITERECRIVHLRHVLTAPSLLCHDLVNLTVQYEIPL